MSCCYQQVYFVSCLTFLLNAVFTCLDKIMCLGVHTIQNKRVLSKYLSKTLPDLQPPPVTIYTIESLSCASLTRELTLTTTFTTTNETTVPSYVKVEEL